jgi:hypothetical protein
VKTENTDKSAAFSENRRGHFQVGFTRNRPIFIKNQ